MKKTTPKGGRKQPRTSAGRKAAPAPREKVMAKPRYSFPIVGLGASAGGLEALEQFLRHVPKNCGLGFVVVQHLDPNHKGIMV
jgi:chemotaxis response regulator CheB